MNAARLSTIACVAAVCLAVFMVVVTVGELVHGRGPAKPREGFQRAMLSLELAGTAAEVHEVLDDAPAPRDQLRRENEADFVFIALYTILFASLATLQITRGGWPRWLGIVALLTTIVAATADVTENVRLFAVLQYPPPSDLGSIGASVVSAAVVKWACVFVTVALLTPLFLRAAGILSRAVGTIFAAGAAVGLVGVAEHSSRIGQGFSLMAPAILLMIFVLARRRSDVPGA